MCVCACVHTCLWLCAGRPCGHSVPRAVFSPDFVGNMWHEAIHLLVMVLSHWCCALHSPRASARYLGSSWARREPSYNSWFPRCISSLQLNATPLQLFLFFPNYANEAFSYWLVTAASRLRIHPVRLLRCKESIVLCAPICESSSIMMRDSPHSSKLLMSFFLSVRGLPRCLVYMWDWQKM